MGYALPLDAIQTIEDIIGDKEKALKVAKVVDISIQKGFTTIEQAAKEQKTILKAELKEELTSELATKKDLEIVRQEIQTLRQELKGDIKELRAYMRFMIIILIIGITIINPNFMTFVKNIIELLK